MSSNTDVNTKRALHELLMLVPDGGQLSFSYGWFPRLFIEIDRTEADNNTLSIYQGNQWWDLYVFNTDTNQCTFFNVDDDDYAYLTRKLFENYSTIHATVVVRTKSLGNHEGPSIDQLAKIGLMEVGVIDLPSTDDTPDPVE